MLIVMIAIGTTDLIFALDSIPAIFGLTKEPYLVFTANVFALMGLRQLYFLLGGLLDRLIYLSYRPGRRARLHRRQAGAGGAGTTTTLPFINGGEHVGWAPHIPIWLSLAVILGTLAVATVGQPGQVLPRPAARAGRRPTLRRTPRDGAAPAVSARRVRTRSDPVRADQRGGPVGGQPLLDAPGRCR